MRRGLGPPVAREDTLLVAVDAEYRESRGEVREGPDLLAHHRVDAVEDTVGHLEQIGLILLGPGDWRDAVETGDGVGAVLGENDRLAVLCYPGLDLRLQRTLGIREVAGVDVPAVIAIQHE